MTPAEKTLWVYLRDKKFMGIKFRRQHPISRFIADFYCHELKLVIEIDGGYHDDREQHELDTGRENELKELGLTIIRFRNEEIARDILGVLDKIGMMVRGPTPR